MEKRFPKQPKSNERLLFGHRPVCQRACLRCGEYSTITHSRRRQRGNTATDGRTDGRTEKGRQSRKKRAPCSSFLFLFPPHSIFLQSEGTRELETIVSQSNIGRLSFHNTQRVHHFSFQEPHHKSARDASMRPAKCRKTSKERESDCGY